MHMANDDTEPRAGIGQFDGDFSRGDHLSTYVQGYAKKALVIGSGFGGLACAIRLQSLGFQTTVFEALDKPGGRAYVYEQDGFTFDAGPTVVTAPECLEELFALSGRRLEDYVELIPVDPMYRLYWEDGVHFDYSRDGDRLLAEIKRLSERDAAQYQRFFNYTQKVYEAGYVKLGHVAFLRLWDMLRVVPALLRVRALRSVYRTVAHYFKDEKIRQAFSFNSLLIGGNPFKVSSIYTLIHPLERQSGVYFAKGGTHALVRALVRLFEDLGGQIKLGCAVERIVTEGGRAVGVALQDGDSMYGDAIVSNSDVHFTYQKLLRDEPRARRSAARLQRKSLSMSLFVLYFGTNRDWPNLEHHNVMFGARYRELLADIFDKGVLADDFSLYLHAPCKTDPDLAPPGHHAFYVLTPVPHLGKAPLQWDDIGDAYANRILDYLEKHYMPGLREAIVTKHLLTPQDFKDRLFAPHGAAFSLEPVLTQSAWFRVHNRDKNIAGLYFVGAGTHPGAGIPGVVGSAKATAAIVVADQPTTAEAYGIQALRYGSQSFNFAARLLGHDAQEAVTALYAWCRYCDDVIDRLPRGASAEEKVKVLADLKQRTLQAYEGQAEHPVFILFANVVKRYRIPLAYPRELLEGMTMDVGEQRYQTFHELRLYCHRVAGVVGMMFSYIVGVSRPEALAYADDLGIAMQLTNIARDIKADFAAGRVYLPLAWLEERGIPVHDMLDPKYRDALWQVVGDLLKQADEYYNSGLRGLSSLPWQAAVAVNVAAHIYRDIGHRLRHQGPLGIEQRVWIPGHRKLWLAFQGSVSCLGVLPQRLRRPWQRALLP